MNECVCARAECLGGVLGDVAAVFGRGPAADQHTLQSLRAMADHRSDGHHDAGSHLGQRIPFPERK